MKYVLVLSVFLTGCVTMGKPFDYANVSKLKTGKTTQAEVKFIFGEPYRRGLDDGDLTWTYLDYYYGLFGPRETRDLTVRFNADGTVKSYSYQTSDPEEKIK
ncbi:MAG: outer membrane protein assembly factor BamE [Elusimicrobia bacterium]|nr:outer membrane protein assembly factor BamE [Elusimicrobiota bacterium]